MQRIVPNLWFTTNAEEAVGFYGRAFPDFKVLATEYYPTEGLLDFQVPFAGQILTIEFEIAGFRFIAINAGEEFRPNPTVSFFVRFEPGEAHQLRNLHASLVEGGRELMPLDSYRFSPQYAWVEDKFGVSWQLITSDQERPRIMPNILFCGPQQGRADEAVNFYTSLFRGKRALTEPYPDDAGSLAGQLMYAEFVLLYQWFIAMDGDDPQWSFSPGVSLMVECTDQAEIDYYWEGLSKVPEAEACGWCVDQFGLSWQIVPERIDDMMAAAGAYQRLLEMKKIDINELLGR